MNNCKIKSGKCIEVKLESPLLGGDLGVGKSVTS